MTDEAKRQDFEDRVEAFAREACGEYWDTEYDFMAHDAALLVARKALTPPKLESYTAKADGDGYGVEAVFKHEHGLHSALAEMCAAILSNPAAPNYFTAEVNMGEGETFQRFEFHVQRLAPQAKALSQALNDLKTENASLKAELDRIKGLFEPRQEVEL